MMIILKNITYIDPFSFDFKIGNILIEKGLDKKIQFVDKISSEAEIVDCTGLFAIKSFVVAHHHAYSALATGMPAPAKNPQNFSEILKYVWWNLDKKLDKETIKASALVTA
ncbi:MAG: amidohydrolase, partial [Bacteroidota bacterium]|nr:amidohydrolase [Bacteroidota bacterium]